MQNFKAIAHSCKDIFQFSYCDDVIHKIADFSKKNDKK